jgi:hypothetical protein
MVVDGVALAVLLLPRARKHIDDRAERKAARHAAPGRRPVAPAPAVAAATATVTAGNQGAAAGQSTSAQASVPGSFPDLVRTGPPDRFGPQPPRG